MNMIDAGLAESRVSAIYDADDSFDEGRDLVENLKKENQIEEDEGAKLLK